MHLDSDNSVFFPSLLLLTDMQLWCSVPACKGTLFSLFWFSQQCCDLGLELDRIEWSQQAAVAHSLVDVVLWWFLFVCLFFHLHFVLFCFVFWGGPQKLSCMSWRLRSLVDILKGLLVLREVWTTLYGGMWPRSKFVTQFCFWTALWQNCNRTVHLTGFTSVVGSVDSPPFTFPLWNILEKVPIFFNLFF